MYVSHTEIYLGAIDITRKNVIWYLSFNPFKPDFYIIIFIHYKPRIAVAILDLQWMKMTWNGWKIEKKLPCIC